MSIVHARIDYRLIHGQVITKWLKRSDANKIIVIDDPLSRDPFLAEVYKMAAPSGVEVIMTSIEDTLQRWNSNSFYEGKLLILFKSIDSALKTIQGGLMLEELQVGGVENTPEEKLSLTKYHSTTKMPTNFKSSKIRISKFISKLFLKKILPAYKKSKISYLN